ncbi:arginine deiminase [uncultured Anaerococcus sp.]|uniref:arginine deiminase n=1 Tax=uncultured Anaerococcus sp. TaxID=293428 RepID=UPI00280B1316|nr:arginine deiminase [uncultured Anaerococcus sp.]MDU5149090.1 arginine deiminase [Anaerococcus prevotii]
MKKINVNNEIKPLKKVLLHRPGEELLNLTPNALDELLFDDIPDLEKAIEEHDNFAKIFKDEGIEVVYLEDLMAETLDQNKNLREEFLAKYLKEANISDELAYKESKKLLESIKDTKQFVLKTMSGITLKELGIKNDKVIYNQKYTAINPMPNLYFTRDPFSSIAEGVSINSMYSVTRSRETIYADYIFNHHKDYKGTKNFYGRGKDYHIEGGDILNINENLLMIGISQRTELDAIRVLAKNVLEDEDNDINEIIGVNIPNERAYMHLDTVFTQIDFDTFTYHPGIISTFHAVKFSLRDYEMIEEFIEKSLDDLLKDALKLDKINLLPCGGGDPIAALREQWTDGSNTLAIAPGKVIVYKRNTVTNQMLELNDIEVIKLDSSTLTVGRGGPRCMSMPLIRED